MVRLVHTHTHTFTHTHAETHTDTTARSRPNSAAGTTMAAEWPPQRHLAANVATARRQSLLWKRAKIPLFAAVPLGS